MASALAASAYFKSSDYSCSRRAADWAFLESSTSPASVLNNTVTCSELRLQRWEDFINKKKKQNARLSRPRRHSLQVNAVVTDDSSNGDVASSSWFHVQDSRVRHRTKVFEVSQAWDVLRHDMEYCDWRARQDILVVKAFHDKVVDILNPTARELKSVDTLRQELAEVHSNLSKAHEQVHISESRVASALQKLSEMEAVMNSMILQDREMTGTVKEKNSSPSVQSIAVQPSPQKKKNFGLTVAGPVKKYSSSLKNFWYPVAFSDDIKEDTMVPFDCFEEPWVLFRGKDGKVGCVRNSCAHRSCPLHLGAVKEGRIQCPYHGWEFSTDGVCEKIPSAKPVNVRIQALPCLEHDGLVWIWPGDDIPDDTLPSLNAPEGYTTHAQIVMELPVEHGLLVENLLDLAHAPFTHTTTFAKGWPVPSLVKFCTPVTALQGYWVPYPIDMEFQPPCMVKSVIGISKPGKLEGTSARDCAKHLHQLHVCLPSSRGKTRLLYRLSLDFYPILKHVPYIDYLWRYLANKVLDEDLRLVLGQQDRMLRGHNVWNMPVAYDKLGVRYRKWRQTVEQEDCQLQDSESENLR